MPWTPDEFLLRYGFCPRCRRVVFHAWPGWREACPERPGRDGRMIPAERAGPLGRVRCATEAFVSDPLPRDRPAIYATLCRLFSGPNPRRDVFGRRLTERHDCAAPPVLDPKAPPRGRLDEVYDVA